MAAEDAFELNAAGVRADRADVAMWVEILAGKLEGALPDCTQVVRHGRLLSKDKRVASVRVRLGSDRFELSRKGDAVQAWREREVAGISIKRESLGLDEWINGLTDALREEAKCSASAREALGRLVE